jgi:hypothetical protein
MAVQTFEYTGAEQTYTPTPRMTYCVVEICGGGGGGGGAGGGVNTQSVGNGGGAGGYAASWYSAATIGASQKYYVGYGGAGGVATGGNGTAGDQTYFGNPALMAVSGGQGGTGRVGVTYWYTEYNGGGAGGTMTSGTANIVSGAGGRGTPGISAYLTIATSYTIVGGHGGSGRLGLGGGGAAGSNVGGNGTGRGGGGGGSGSTTVNHVGASGSNGIIIITEFCD